MGYRLVRSLALAAAVAAAVSAPAHAQDTTPAAPADSTAVRFPAARVRCWQVGLLRPDRIQHASLSMTLGLAAGLITRKPVVAACSGLGFGLAKELYDIRGTGFDLMDLLADGVGSGVGALGTHYIED
jgi:hypothetical protein